MDLISRKSLYIKPNPFLHLHLISTPSRTNLFLQLIQQLGRRLLTVSLRVIARPAPEILASLLEGMFGLPAELGVSAGRVSGEVKNVTSATGGNLVGHLAADGVGEGGDHLVDGATLSGSQVPGAHTGVIAAEVVEGFEVAVGEIEDVDVVTDGGAVAGVVVCWFVS